MMSATAYLIVKAVHVIAVIAWMAGLLYLPRLFVYHADEEPGSATSEKFKIMERRLLKAIMNPAMIVSVVLGLVMIADLGWDMLGTLWLGGKVACVIGLLAMHMAMGKWRRAFAEDRNVHSHKYYRVMNEIPTLLMIVIVVLVIVKPGF
jgi:putative membrane protein